jgi:hypothetical protein
MSSSLFLFFLLNLFNFFFSQISPNYRFFFTINDDKDNKFELTIEDNPLGKEFSSFLINKKEITLSFDDYASYAYYNHDKVFPMLENYQTNDGDTFPPNALVETNFYLFLIKTEYTLQQGSLVARFDPTPNYPSQGSYSITFKAEEIKTDVNEDDNDQTDVNEDDNDLVVNVLIPISIVSLIILYYLLLLLYA